MKKLFPLLAVIFILAACTPTQDQNSIVIIEGRWTKEEAFAWQEKHGWMAGCNFNPSTAINQLEHFQAESFDPETINRELGWAADIGMSIVRVYLHDLLWSEDPESFLRRLDQFLDICKSHEIKVMFVLFDDCWYGNPQKGSQRDPAPGIHNSGWLQSPSYAAVMDKSEWPRLKAYAQGVMRHFADDERVILWDLYNEPVNNHYREQIFPLVKEVFRWAREVDPSQPLTVGCWKWTEGNWPMNEFCLANSDIISFHNYSNYESMAKDIEKYKSFGRPVICSEYLARGNMSLFETHLPLMKRNQVSAINWGLVDGKTQTKYPWNHPLGVTEIEPWHHEVFHADGSPYRQHEVEIIKRLTQK